MKVFQTINMNTHSKKIMQVLDKGWRDYYRFHNKPPTTLCLSWNLICYILMHKLSDNRETMFMCDVVKIYESDDLYCFE